MHSDKLQDIPGVGIGHLLGLGIGIEVVVDTSAGSGPVVAPVSVAWVPRLGMVVVGRCYSFSCCGGEERILEILQSQ